DDRPYGVAAGAPIDIVLEALLVEPALYFLDLLQSGRAFAARELLAEWWIAPDQVAEMAKRQRVASGWIVRIDRLEILPEKKRRSASDWDPELCLVARAGKGATVGAADAEIAPFRVRTHRPVICEARRIRRHFDLTAPGLAALVVSALSQIVRRASQCIV